MTLAADLDLALDMAAAAGEAALAIYHTDFTVDLKGDGSPITLADRTANEIILAALAEHRPDDAVLSEESPFEGVKGARLWMIDPLDGTKDFAGKTGDFAVMIGLCVDGVAMMGVVAAPALGRTWGGIVGDGAFELVDGVRRPMVAQPPADPLRVLASRKHPPSELARVIEKLPGATRIPRGSVGIKSALVAGGEADLYLHPTRGTHLWDCCAPEAIARAAGLEFTLPSGAGVRYDPAHTANPYGVLVAHPTLHARIRGLLEAD